MMQPKLFETDGPIGHHGMPIEARTMAARKDPSTSLIAAQEVIDSGAAQEQLRMVFRVLARNQGFTSAELAKMVSPSREMRYIFARRLGDLKGLKFGYARHGEKRRCGVSGKLAVTWWLTEKGRAAAA